ncbi:hypothetical protein [Actinoplanes utahensis]|uniref:Uncharacterized protein n=1 Tax=Actinoplanes utahensis TaxID=1869 RepID=A0A0A6UN19_ACTUT|nr:hypothetical protein [Actinoplanes utahensis]KHD77530.1 hypothetical protein MB27_10555 [Actinoplanes utahensis]
MTDDAVPERLAAELRALPMPVLLDVLGRVLPERDEGFPGSRTALVLAAVTANAEVPGLTMEVVAWPGDDPASEEGLTRIGSCRRCGFEVTSTAKHAFCPMCRSACYLT